MQIVSSMNILLIEDEQKIAAFIKSGLEAHRHHVLVAYDGEQGYKMCTQYDFDVVVLDIMIPVFNGLDVCKRIKARRREMPVLLLSALGTIQDKVEGLEAGADDYLTKPFHFDELLARLKALSRRNLQPLQHAVYQVADLEMDCEKRMVTRNGQEIKLTLKEFTMLETFLMNRNRVLTRIEIAEAVWGLNFNNRTNLIDVYVNYVRTKVDKGFSQPLIHTVTGVGYVLKG